MKITKNNIKYIILDAIIIVLSLGLALYLRFDGFIPQRFVEMFTRFLPYVLAFKLIAYIVFNIYSVYWKNASVSEALLLGFSVSTTSFLVLIYLTMFKYSMPRSVIIISAIIEIIFMGLIRYIEKFRHENHVAQDNTLSDKRVLIIGAGQSGLSILNEINHHRKFGKVVAFVDDDLSKQDALVKGIKVCGKTSDIEKVVREKKINSIIFAIPTATHQRRAEILDSIKHLNIQVKIVPGIYEIIDGKVDFAKIRDVSIDDLLGRDQVSLDNSSLKNMIMDKTILVTGGGGSIGSELCRQIAKYRPKKLVILDVYENNAYSIQLELLRNYRDLDLDVCIESIRDRDRIEYIFSHYRPDIVFHAAAHKHVPLMEDSYISAVKNNVFGTKNLLEMADKYKVSKFVNISTDKAVNPTNIMGATKRIIEIMLQAIDKKSETDYVAVRFGNVLGSNGSVIPLFKKQIEEGGPVTVTHKDIIRYFMTIPEACQLVLQAGSIARGGEIFILDMGKPVKILDLAENLIRLSGFVPYEDIKIEFTGLRPGEKLFEELILDLDNSDKTVFDKIYIERPASHDEGRLKTSLEELNKLCKGCEKEEMVDAIKRLVPEFNHKENK